MCCLFGVASKRATELLMGTDDYSSACVDRFHYSPDIEGARRGLYKYITERELIRVLQSESQFVAGVCVCSTYSTTRAVNS